MSEQGKKHEKGIVRHSVSMPLEFKERVEQLARDESRSFSSQMVYLARQAMEQQETAPA